MISASRKSVGIASTMVILGSSTDLSNARADSPRSRSENYVRRGEFRAVGVKQMHKFSNGNPQYPMSFHSPLNPTQRWPDQRKFFVDFLRGIPIVAMIGNLVIAIETQQRHAGEALLRHRLFAPKEKFEFP